MSYLKELKRLRSSMSNDDLFNHLNYIEFNDKYLSINDVDALKNQFSYIISTTPDVNYYANIWLEILLDPSIVHADDESFKKHVEKFKLTLPENINTYLNNRNQPQLLYYRLFIATNILIPIILIESGIAKSNKKGGYTKKKYVIDKYRNFRKLVAP